MKHPHPHQWRAAIHKALVGSHLLYYGALASGWHSAHAAAGAAIFVLLLAGLFAGARVPPGA